MREPRLDPFVGRAAELGRLGEVVTSALADGPLAALVVGEPGIGKTRLVEAAVRARPEGVGVLRGEATDGDATAFGLWAGVLRELGPRGHAPADDATERRWEVLDDLVAGLGAAAPAIVVLDDLHWADEASTWVLERLLRAAEGTPLVVLATARREGPGTTALAAFRRQVDLIELAGLGPGPVAELADALQAEGVDPAALAARTGGNPLFLRELLVGHDGSGVLPDVVSEVLQRTLDRLDAADRHVLAALALAGTDVPLDVLATATGEEAGVALDRLEAAARLDVVRVEGRRATFRHALLAEAATSRLAPADRRALHAALGAAWAGQGRAGPSLARRARHLLAAVPTVDAAEAAGAATEAIAALRAAGDPAGAAEVGRQALVAVGDDPGVPLERRVRLAVDAAEAMEVLGDGEAQVGFERAADLALDLDHPELRARAEVGACRRANPFVPDPDRIRRLTAVDAELSVAQPESALRADLLGRLAVLHVASPDGIDAGHRHGDAAIAIARRLGDASALARACSDRHLVAATGDGELAKAEVAEELVALGERQQRPEVLLQGLEWQFTERLDRLDLVEADRLLSRMEAYAQLQPGPRWRAATLLRRSTLDALGGRRDDALATLEQATSLHGAFLEDGEVVGVDVGWRTYIALLWGRTDAEMPARHARQATLLGQLPPVPFLQISAAASGWVLGLREDGQRCIDRFGPDPDRLLAGMNGAGLVSLLATMAADAGGPQHAAALRRTLAPFERRLATGVVGFFHLPVATTLGRLALLDGDGPAAVDHHRIGLELARRAPSPPLVARAAAHLAEALRAVGGTGEAAELEAEAVALAATLGMVLPGAPDPADAGEPRAGAPVDPPVARAVGSRRASLVRTGAGWQLTSPYGAASVADSVGLGQLAALLAASGREVPATELVGMDAASGTLSRDLGPALDARAKREYRQRIGELQADIDQAEADHDPERSVRARLELDAILDELRRAVGLGGKDRPSGSGAERARVNATRSVRRAIATIAAVVPDLGAHLEVSIRTGRYCSYTPEPATAMAWDVSP